MDRRQYEKRPYDRDHHHQAKRPKLDHTPNQPHRPFRPSPNHSNGISRHAKLTVQLPSPLPDLPPITEEYSKPTFTHTSQAPREFELGIMQSYERLEFLGDAYIEIIATRLIWSCYKNLQTGRMASIREMLVKNETLSEYSVAYGFDKRVDVSPAAKPTNRTTQIKLHGDIFEAYVAAIVLSDPVEGFRTAEEWLVKLWEPLLRDVEPEPKSMKAKDELRQKIWVKDVRLDYVEERPAVHGKGIETYFVGVYITGHGYDNQHLGSGQGLSKKAAGMEAATKALSNRPLIDELIAKKEARQAEIEKEKVKEDSERDCVEKGV